MIVHRYVENPLIKKDSIAPLVQIYMLSEYSIAEESN